MAGLGKPGTGSFDIAGTDPGPLPSIPLDLLPGSTPLEGGVGPPPPLPPTTPKPASPNPDTVPTPGVTVCPYVLNDGIGKLYYCRNYSLDPAQTPKGVRDGITRAIIVFHGGDSIAKDYFETTIAEAQALIGAGELPLYYLHNTVILAPSFLVNFPPAVFPASNTPWYNWKGWAVGETPELSHESGPSSFEIIDWMLEQLLEIMPNIETVVVAGQSGGGQFVGRYGLLTPIPDLHPDVQFTFWAANSGSFMYLTPWRAAGTPAQLYEKCHVYDYYPLGIVQAEFGDNLPDDQVPFNHYVQHAGDHHNPGIFYRRAFLGEINKYYWGEQNETVHPYNRTMYWTVGENDTDSKAVPSGACFETQDSSYGDGLNRNLRWTLYKFHLEFLCRDFESESVCQYWTNSHFFEIGGAGHGHGDSWTSKVGHAILFGTDFP